MHHDNTTQRDRPGRLSTSLLTYTPPYTCRHIILRSFSHSIISLISSPLLIMHAACTTLGAVCHQIYGQRRGRGIEGFARPPAPDDLPYFPMPFQKCRSTVSLLALFLPHPAPLPPFLHASLVVVPFSVVLPRFYSNCFFIFRPLDQNKTKFATLCRMVSYDLKCGRA